MPWRLSGSTVSVDASLRARQVSLRLCTIAIAIALYFVVSWAYRKNHPLVLLLALGSGLGWCAVWMRFEQRRISGPGWMAWQRVAAAIAALALIESGYRVSDHLLYRHPRSSGEFARPVTYSEAQGDPQAFAQWWNAYVVESHRDAHLVQQFTPGGPVPYVFKPNTSRPYFRNWITINSHQMYDKEVPLDKGDKFRIVVMGSSHSMGPQIEADGTSWPTKLERLIHERVAGGDRIEVLNAGAAAYTMEHNLHRLRDVVLPLKPDMIITYFGYNDYAKFHEDFRLSLPIHNPKTRASHLVGKVECRLRKWISQQPLFVESIDDIEKLQPRLETCPIAQLYREYVNEIRTHGIDLVVCNFNMAIDLKSPPEVVRFYEGGFPEARFIAQANVLNDALLPLIIRPETGAKLIDVHSGLNGAYGESYLDLVHMSEQGKALLAENVFHGIVEMLPKEVSPGSRNRAPQLAAQPGESAH